MSRGIFLQVITAAVFAVAFFFSTAEAHAGPKWWNKAWPYRRAVEVSKRGQEYGDTDLAWCTFGAGEEMSKNGRDIRVTDENGKLVPHAIVYAEPGKRCEIVFKTNGPGTYYVYYGNRKAGPGAKSLKLERGLVLETRNRPRGRCNSWSDFQKLLKQSTTVYGRGVRRKVYDGFNPYGPSDNYISIYTGYIYCQTPGTYRFASNSDNSSFVFVDGKKIVDWPGEHGPSGAYGQHNGAAKLSKGFHKLEYYHEESTGGQACVLGWWTPEAKQVCLVPERAFPAFLRGRAFAVEKAGSDTACDFVFQYASDMQLPGHLYCEVKLFDYSKSKGKVKSWKWDFGDGATSTEKNPVHIYCAPGYYRIKLTVTGSDGKKDSTYRSIYAGQLFITVQEREKTERYARVIKSYKFDKLNTAGLLGALALLEFVGDAKPQVKVCRELVERSSKLKSSQRYDVLLKLGDLLRKEVKDADGALKAYQQIVNESITKKRTLMGKIGVADVTFQLKKEYDKAFKMYEEIIEKYRDISLAYCRLAQIRIGDIWREQGDYTKSLEAYEKTKKMRRLIGHLDKALERGQLAITIEAYLREKEYEPSLKKLDLWDWEYPEDKLTGYPSLLRAKANYGLGKFDDVIEDLTSLVKVNSGKDVEKPSNYLAEAKYMIAYAMLRQEKYKETVEIMERLIKEHPESDLLKKAQEVIDQCRKQLGK
jgi:tetratricopeptide (TPR) repeat protein